MPNNDIALLSELLSSGELQQAEKKFIDKIEMWGESPFRWLAFAAPATKGALGKKLVAGLCQKNGMTAREVGRGSNLVVERRSVVVKFAMLGEGDTYFFEQVRDTDYEFLFWLGLSPQAAHAWVFRKNEALRHMKKQRQDEKWVHVQPSNPPGWMKTQSGKLTDACNTFRQLLRK